MNCSYESYRRLNSKINSDAGIHASDDVLGTPPLSLFCNNNLCQLVLWNHFAEVATNQLVCVQEYDYHVGLLLERLLQLLWE